MLLWVNNHFNDFETNADMCEFLEHFEQLLEREVSHVRSSVLSMSIIFWSVPMSTKENLLIEKYYKDKYMYYTTIIPRRSRRDIFLVSSVRPFRPSVQNHISVPIGQI